jgi:hypothetical protein
MTKVKSGNGYDLETVRKMYEVIKDKKYDQADIDKEWKIICDSGVKISQSDYNTFIGIQEKMSFEEFSNFYLHDELPAMKLNPQQMDALKAGMTFGQFVANLAVT